MYAGSIPTPASSFPSDVRSSAIEMPTCQSFILHAIHHRSNSTNAIALSSLAFNGVRPLLAEKGLLGS